MMWIKIKRDCSLGRKGEILEMTEQEAKSWIESEMVVKSNAPKVSGYTSNKPEIKNKAMSA